MQRVIGVTMAVVLCFATACLPAHAVSAGSAVLMEWSTGTVLYEKDAHTPRPMASTTKLMTALVASLYHNWERPITVTGEMVAVEGTAVGLRAGDQLTLRDAVCGMLLASGNDAANAVALTLAGSFAAFAEKMNACAKEIGMNDSHFVTPSGLDAEGHMASAYDMALLASRVLCDPVLSEICAMKSAVIHISGRAVTVTNHNRLLSLYDGTIGLKTGFTKKSGRCLVSAARRDGVTVIAVTLNDGNDWNDHMTLFDMGFSAMRAVELPSPVLPQLTVSGGVADRVALCAESPTSVVLPVGQEGNVVMELHLPRFVLAPVEAGEQVGYAEYTLNGESLMQLPITAQKAVAARPVATKMQRFYQTVALLWYGLFN